MNWHAPMRIFISILLTNVLIISMVGLLVWLNLFDNLQTDFTFAHTMYMTVGILNTIIILVLFHKVDKKNSKILGFGMKKLDILFSIASIAVSFLCVISFIFILDQLEIVAADYQFEKLLTGPFYKILGLAMVGWFFAALKEEVLARGYFIANLTKTSIPTAIMVSAILFMALHFIMGDFDPYKAGSWLKGGIVYAYIYIKSGSLTVSTITHAAHNLVNDLVIHGSEGALVLLNIKVTTADKLVYELALGTLLLILAYLFYGKNGVFTPADHLKPLWAIGGKTK
jgi:membrane protease YdiL (CAAX protease family)